MNIGIHYNLYDGVAIILYALNNSNIILDDYKSSIFKIENQNDTYHFSKNYDDIRHCDKTILASHASAVLHDSYKESNQYDKVVLSKTQDDFFDSPILIKNFLDKGNICLTANLIRVLTSTCENHTNFLYDPVFNLILIYYSFGYQFLNYYKFDRKDNLMGVYNQKLHIDGGVRNWRNRMHTQVHSILGDDLKTYPFHEYPLRKIIEPPYRTNLWQGVKMSGYIDFTTSVCNLVFETGGLAANRSHMSEKTLKSIIFCEENIFFILYGSWAIFKKLNDLGFWFLNSEFCDFNNDNHDEIINSVIKATVFLKELKDSLNTNNLVHEHLLKMYGEKLKHNVTLFNDLLNNCKNTDKILELIKK